MINIIEKIKTEIEVYGQDNSCPRSLTIVEDKYWRHYEFGEIYGFVAYNEFSEDGEEYFGLCSIEEDDGYWSIPNHAMCIALAWIKPIFTTYERMKNWVEEYINEGWKKDENYGDPKFYIRELKKPVCYEVIPWVSNNVN